MTERIALAASRALERRTSRRGLIARIALVGSAVAVGPLRYLLRPGDALAVIRCADCGGGRCCDGWTEMCCTINGGVNACPAGSFMGGWWKCTDYGGSKLCAGTGVRYYVDCNRSPGASCPGGCHCAGDSCGNRSTCCNVFRYGQCSPGTGGVTEVVCRMVTCQNPCSLFPDVCNCTMFIDNRTCTHEAACLEPRPEAEPLAPYRGLGGGAGGGYGE